MQRVAIARAIALPPRALFADEPTGNLDADSAAGVMEHFCRLNRMGITVLLATHNLALTCYATRHVVCLQGGHLVETAVGGGPS